MRTIAALTCALAVWLTAFAATGAQKPAADPPKPLIKEFLGLNAHFTFKPELYKQVARLARNYHNMVWDVGKPGDTFDFPHCPNGVDWTRDVYGKWAKEGFETDICAQLVAFGPDNPQYKALWKGREQWAYEYGRAMAAYFGPSGRQKLCTSIEIDNEPGAKFDDALYRDLFSRMAQGIRAGDPRVKIVTCNVRAGPADDYTKSLQETFGLVEMKKLFDVINLHTYAFKPKKEGQSPWDRTYPEDPATDYLKTVDDAIAWRDKEAPGKEIWVTEFGWDACTEAAMKNRKDWALKLNWTGVTDLQQAEYLVRSVFVFAERDVRRAYIYYYDDDDGASVHASSGLTRKFQPKPSFWAVRHLYETLGDCRFSRVVRKVDGDVYVYEFTRDAGPTVWVAWSPTDSGRQAEVTLRGLPARPARIERMPTEKGPAPEVKWTQAGDGAVTFTVTESPSYIIIQK
jgi:hypothetical protein